jgi:hypothetical protein
VYDELSRPASALNIGQLAQLGYMGLPPVPVEYNVLNVQRRDTLQTDLYRAEQRSEDVGAEVTQLRGARDAVVRPRGLGGGLAVLAAFTVVGVIILVWLLSRGPKQLTVALGEVVFWLFAGLVALLGYMAALALRLSGRWQRMGRGLLTWLRGLWSGIRWLSRPLRHSVRWLREHARRGKESQASVLPTDDAGK